MRINRDSQRLVTYTIIKTKVILVCLKMGDFIYENVSIPAIENEAIYIFDNSKSILTRCFISLTLAFLFKAEIA